MTLDPAPGPALAAVRELGELRGPEPWAVKDSFGVLRLESAGFRPLFAAEWIVLPAGLVVTGTRAPGVRPVRIDSERALAAWEEAWGESRGQPRVFLPELLGSAEIAILALVGDEGTIEAGVIAHRGEEAVGLSNLFLRGPRREALRAECIRAALETFPGLPLVGYESGRELAEASALGFQPLGTLRVWLRNVAETR